MIELSSEQEFSGLVIEKLILHRKPPNNGNGWIWKVYFINQSKCTASKPNRELFGLFSNSAWPVFKTFNLIKGTEKAINECEENVLHFRYVLPV